MAWIKMRTDLSTDPAVIRMASILNADDDLIVGKLHRLWAWADAHTTDGVAEGVTDKWVDKFLGVAGFARAMQDAGWLEVTADRIVFPRFDIHNGESAKKRDTNTERQRLSRIERDKRATEARPEERREEKKREEKAKDTGGLAPAGGRAELVYLAYPRKVGKQAALKAIQTAGKRLAGERFAGDLDAAAAFLLARTQAYAASRIVQTTPNQFIKHPASWFNAGCYDDDPREWDRARTGSDADQVPIGGSTLDVMLANMGVDNGQTANGRDGEVPRGNVPAMEGHAGTGARVGDNVLRISG